MTLSLSGEWEVVLDPEAKFTIRDLDSQEFEVVTLPGSLDQSGIGVPNEELGYLGGLSRKVSYIGAAWYRAKIQVPVILRSQVVTLELERCHWVSELWVNGEAIGSNNSLCVPHEYSFELSESGSLEIVLKIDNTPSIPIGRIGHSLTDWTQTNWNGVVGSIQLRAAKPAFSINEVRRERDGFLIRGRSAEPVRALLPDDLVVNASQPTSAEFLVHIKRDQLARWSDENPSLTPVKLVSGTCESTIFLGLRDFSVEGRFFKLNDDLVFLRGTLDCCVFPKTGFPSMDVESWRITFRTIKSFGLNHVRFHSWCPPEAAFVAADELGVLLQVECPLWTGHWSLSSDPELLRFIQDEAFRILSTYGHHPSFVLFCLGNEMAFYGEEPGVDALLLALKSEFPHVLFNFSSHGTHLSSACDYYVQADNGKPGTENRPLRGSTWFGVGSRFDREAPASSTDCSEAADQFDRPVIAHEVGEWAVFPDLAEIPKYDGVLEARNFEWIKAQLGQRGMAGQAADFTQASGKLSSKLYKEEIETLLRTSNLAGYQLLGLSDFPGQGTATIGMLNAFWEPKGFVTAEEFRQYASATVPLLSLEKFVWTQGETLVGSVRVAHSGSSVEGELRWQIFGDYGQRVSSGTLGRGSLEGLQPNDFGTLQVPLDHFEPNQKYTLSLTFGQSTNEWTFWVFSDDSILPEVGPVEVFHWYRADVRKAIQQGKKIWLRLNSSKCHMGIPGRFAPAFWSPIHFVEQVGTLGTVIQSDHPIFEQFPTESHSDWHWWEILLKSQSLNLNEFPAEFRPLVQVIDRYERNHKLGTIFEARIGEAALLITFIDFDAPDRPVCRQLERSIRHYVNSPSFNPGQEIALATLDQIFRLQP